MNHITESGTVFVLRSGVKIAIFRRSRSFRRKILFSRKNGIFVKPPKHETNIDTSAYGYRTHRRLCRRPHPAYPTDTLPTPNGRTVQVTFFKHASLAFDIDGRRIYVDPVGSFADYASLPKADLILITHHHYDHYDPEAVALVSQPGTRIVCDATTAGADRGGGRRGLGRRRTGRAAAPLRRAVHRDRSGLQHHGRDIFSSTPRAGRRGLPARVGRAAHLRGRRRGEHPRDEGPAGRRRRLPCR